MLYGVPRLDSDDERVLVELDGLRDRLRHQVARPHRWTGLLRRELVARGIQGSNSIEGIRVSLADAEAAVAGEAPLDTDAATWSEISGYRTALAYVQQLAGAPEFAYQHMLLNALHFMMLGHRLDSRPGRYRGGDIHVIDSATATSVYNGPDAARVAGLMEELADWLNAGDRDAPALVRAALAHLNLVSIHPWRDGNGRMSRCLQTLVVARAVDLAPEFSSIEEWLGAGRNTYDYYDALREVQDGSFQPDLDAHSWVRFSLRAHHLQAQLVERRLRAAAELWQALEDMVRRQGIPERATNALYAAATGVRLRRSTYQRDEDLSTDQATRDLRQLVAIGFLGQHGETRSRFYVAGEAITDLYRRIAAPDVVRRLREPYPA